jgi:hypothetical protein
VITEGERLRRMAAARNRSAVHFYVMELQKGLYIDAEHMGSNARFMNSSCDPNCETQKWKDAATGALLATVSPLSMLRERRPKGCLFGIAPENCHFG